MVDHATDDMRRAGICPLCSEASHALHRLAFAARPNLPTVVELEYCERCNFLFVGDLSGSSYARHYASVRNDGRHVVASDDAGSDDRLQVEHLIDVLPHGFAGDVLDFGCGQGRLLRRLAARFTNASLYGHDVADYLHEPGRVRFLSSVENLSQRFDLIVVSHVLEHLVGFASLKTLVGLLKPGGLIYVEVPDPFGYADCQRREFMYYFDRLHINHFGGRAMRRLLGDLGLEEIGRGTHRFRYRDGHYPAAYWIAARGDGRERDADRPLPAEPSFDAVFEDYREREQARAAVSRRRIAVAAGRNGVLVYGAGDNFRRARWAGGPLDGVPLLAVLDQRADDLPPEAGIRFERPDAALARHPTVPVVITVSEDSEAIADRCRAGSPDRDLYFV